MTARQQGIYDHKTVEMMETAYRELRRMGITGPIADKIAKAFVTRASGFTAEQAIGAATRPAGEPESSAPEPEPTRQA